MLISGTRGVYKTFIRDIICLIYAVTLFTNTMQLTQITELMYSKSFSTYDEIVSRYLTHR